MTAKYTRPTTSNFEVVGTILGLTFVYPTKTHELDERNQTREVRERHSIDLRVKISRLFACLAGHFTQLSNAADPALLFFAIAARNR